jgi:hypothetical protein
MLLPYLPEGAMTMNTSLPAAAAAAANLPANIFLRITAKDFWHKKA